MLAASGRLSESRKYSRSSGNHFPLEDRVSGMNRPMKPYCRCRSLIDATETLREGLFKLRKEDEVRLFQFRELRSLGQEDLYGNGWRAVFSRPLPWQERRFARRIGRELLKLYWFVSARHPDLRGRGLYRTIVASRTRMDPESAEALLDQAEESFAAWPTRRTLKFRDVVHLIAVSEFLASHGDSSWTQTNMGREVASQIPANL